MVENMTKGGEYLPVVEDFYTVQGEGFNAGRAAYFIRLGGCDAGCSWCDAKYTWNGAGFPLTRAETIASRAAASGAIAAVITGGEPLMHPLGELVSCLQERGLKVFLETAGTHPLSGNFNWICLSPKRQLPPVNEVCMAADEMKVVVESEADFRWAEECARRVKAACRLYLQPEWNEYDRVIGKIVDYVKSHPQWLVSLQTHKFMKVP